MELADFDRDGRLDLLVTGAEPQSQFPDRVGGPPASPPARSTSSPTGPFGHSPGGTLPAGTVTTSEVNPVVVGDFNKDGLPDFFAVIRNMTVLADGSYSQGDSTYQMRVNQGSRTFIDRSPSPWVNLGRVTYPNLMAIDMNNDGFLDVVGNYTKEASPGSSPQWGTTLFLNDGTGAFQIVDGAQFIGVTTTPPNGGRWGLGSFVPTVVRPGRTEGIVYESIGGCGTPGGCTAVGMNLYKIVANGSLGGPTVGSVSPNGGSTAGGTAVTIVGTGFVTPATVTLDGTAALAVAVANATTITATTPAHAAGIVERGGADQRPDRPPAGRLFLHHAHATREVLLAHALPARGHPEPRRGARRASAPRLGSAATSR